MANCPPKSPICSDTSCPIKFKAKSCQCRTVRGDACQPIKTVCAYEENGELYGCPVGCCNNQCDGECGVDSVTTKYKPFEFQMQKYVLALVILLLGLLLMSSVSV